MNETLTVGIKKESIVKTERENQECVVCSNRNEDNFDIYSTKTNCSNRTLIEFLCKFTNVDLTTRIGTSKFMCKLCFSLVNILEEAEVEYNKLKENFESLLSRNPIFDSSNVTAVNIQIVKRELEEACDDYSEVFERSKDSDDEPLIATKSKNPPKVKKYAKKIPLNSKKKIQRKRRKEKSESDSNDLENGNSADEVIKTETNDSAHTNGFDNPQLKIEIGEESFIDDDRSQDFVIDDDLLEDDDEDSTLQAKRIKKTGKRKKKPILKCDQCDAKYSSPARLACHKLKHDSSKPPYICEICGAHYKHKRACDIHIALHKGISDWKCEECNKLFPSKGSLARHNNIHTGKPNYQCDLCGKSFIHTSSFKMHKLAHSGVKPHACDVCGLALMTRSHLKRHKRVHSGEKRHECAHCGKRFSERYNLAAHAKSHEAPAAAAAAPAAPAPAPLRRTFRCVCCAARFERRYMLERHLEAEHQQRLERAPPKPRNTMSKLLKAQAALSTLAAPAAAAAAPAARAARGAARPFVLVVDTDDPKTEGEGREGQGEGGGVGAGAGAGAAEVGGGQGEGGRDWHDAYASYTHHYAHT